jgi:hypothetical protein
MFQLLSFHSALNTQCVKRYKKIANYSPRKKNPPFPDEKTRESAACKFIFNM